MTPPNNPNGHERLLTVQEVCEYLGAKRKRDWVYAHASRKRKNLLPFYKLGGAVPFKISEIDAFVESCRREELP
jgi:excisionase family DNA binding protein